MFLESSRLWRETVQAMEEDFPEVTVSYEFVDAVAMRLVQWPKSLRCFNHREFIWRHFN